MSEFSLEGVSINTSNSAQTSSNSVKKNSVLGIDIEEGLIGRGGACLVNVLNSFALLFSGADRSPQCLCDLWKYDYPSNEYPNGTWLQIDNDGEGEVPMARSESSAVSYGKYVFVFGGVDFGGDPDDENSPGITVFNELYVLDTETWNWRYVGEQGCEILARSNHSINIIYDKNQGKDGDKYLVIFGGANPEKGPLNDTIIAKLPSMDDIGKDDVYVKWEVLNTSSPSPSMREMHATTVVDGSLYISGGKNGADLMNDVWKLSITKGTNDDDKPVFVWNEVKELILPTPRCGHGMITSSINELIIFGGAVGESFMSGISINNDMISISTNNTSSTNNKWNIIFEKHDTIATRFSTSMCSKDDDGAMIIFGGMNEEKDHGDIWIIN